MAYSVSEAAAEIMVDPEDLKEVYEIYFNESQEILSRCCSAQAAGDWEALAKLSHALKGASSNLRIHSIRCLAEQLEKSAKAGEAETVRILLPALDREFTAVQEEVQSYFSRSKS